MNDLEMSKQLIMQMHFLLHCWVLLCVWGRNWAPAVTFPKGVRPGLDLILYFPLGKSANQTTKVPWGERCKKETGGCVW